jgi:hypothetical protein
MYATISPVGRVLRPTGRFIGHLLSMCAVMCVGMGILDALYFGAARLIGYSNPITQLPELTVLVVAVNMSVPMVAWMRYGGHEWRPIWEMSGAMFVEAIVVLGVAWAALVPKSSLFALQHALMVPAMIIPMVFRLDLYAARTHHHARRTKAAPSVETVPSEEKLAVHG